MVATVSWRPSTSNIDNMLIRLNTCMGLERKRNVQNWSNPTIILTSFVGEKGNTLFGWFFSKEKLLFPINHMYIIPNKVPQLLSVYGSHLKFFPTMMRLESMWENETDLWCQTFFFFFWRNLMYEGRGNLITLSFPPLWILGRLHTH